MEKTKTTVTQPPVLDEIDMTVIGLRLANAMAAAIYGPARRQ